MTTLRGFLRRRLSQKSKVRLRDIYAKLFVSSGNLRALSRLYGTDKWIKDPQGGDQQTYQGHHYAQHYETHFRKLRFRKMNVLEIGVGGYENPEHGGASLRAWRCFFPRSTIYGLDLYEKRFHEERRIKTFRCSQDDPDSLRRVVASIGHLDIIIDDGSHVNSHVITTFETLFPLLGNDGIYVVEDTLTSYRPEYGGDARNRQSDATMMGYFKGLIDGLNHKEIPAYGNATYFDRTIISMHFYHNLVFIYKGRNEEQGWRGSSD